MSNKDRNKRSARQARQRERISYSGDSKTPVKVSTSSNNTGIVARTKNYFSDVRSEMRRVTWPSRTELTNYSVAVIATLIVFGVAIWAVDTGFVAALVAFTSLRG